MDLKIEMQRLSTSYRNNKGKPKFPPTFILQNREPVASIQNPKTPNSNQPYMQSTQNAAP